MRGSRNFRQGVGGVQVYLAEKRSDNVFCGVFFMQMEFNGLIREINISKVLVGSNILRGGGGGGGGGGMQ